MLETGNRNYVDALETYRGMVTVDGSAMGFDYSAFLSKATNNATLTTDGLLDFRVIAGMEEGNFASEVAQGYSVDNLSPSVPNTLEYEFIEDDNEVQITWDSEHDPDFNYYTIINNLDETVIHTTDNTHSFDFEESIEMDFNIAKIDLGFFKTVFW